MYVEIRKKGKSKKYYLAHSYRVGDRVKKISRYLGSNLSEKELDRLRRRAEELIKEEIKERNILEYELSKEEIELYKRYDGKIKIGHFQKYDWKKFTEIFTYNTNAIEGSTLEFSEVKKLLEDKEVPKDSDDLEALDVANALEYMNKAKGEISVDFIKKIHLYCFKNTKSFAGKLRNVEVVVTDRSGRIIHRGAPFVKVRILLNELVGWYDKHRKKYPPLLLAAIIHDQFETIHPFQDGNGRVGRILLNYILKKHKYPYINVRLKDRQEYYGILHIFQTKGDIKPTLRFLINQYRIQYRYIR